jgi:phage I-like protein
MPWSKKNPPRPAKNWSPAAQALCTRVANAVLKKTNDDSQAIYACIHAVKLKYPDQINKGKKKAEVGLQKAKDVAQQVFSLEGITFEKVTDAGTERYVSKGVTMAVGGKFVHPFWGEFNLSEEVLRQFKRNFDRKVLGTDVAIDERHDRGRAMGWIKNVHSPKSQEYNGKNYLALLGDIEWTPEGRKLLEDKIYKYFSPEFGTYVEADGKTEHNNVLLGGALTNRPFLKMMPSVKFEDDVKPAGTVKDVLAFDDDSHEGDKDWEFEPENEEVAAFSAGYHYKDLDEIIEEIDDDEDDDDTDDEDEDEVKLEDFLAQLKKDLGVEFADGAALVAALKAGASASTNLEGVKEKLKEAGIQFDEKTPVADIVVAALAGNSSQVKVLSEQVATLSKTLAEDKRKQAVDKLIDDKKIIPADRKVYEEMWDKDVALFESVTKTLKPAAGPAYFGEMGGTGVSEEPGQTTEYQDDAKAEEKARETLKMIGLTPRSETNVPAGARS